MRFWRPPLYQLELLACALFRKPNLLASFAVQGVMTTPLAVLLELDTVRIILLVLLGRIIAAFAFGARQSDQSTHEFSFYLFVSSRLLAYT